MTTTRRLDTKQTAAAMRKALHSEFPGVKFSVRMGTGTAYGRISVSWVDGPTTRDAEAVTHPFESSTYDSMNEYYRQTENTVIVDGETVTPNCCGITIRRTVSDDAMEWASTVT